MADQHETAPTDNILHPPEGKGCLTRHVGVKPSEGVGNPCSHRWNAYERMKETRSFYDWPNYKSLTDAGERVRTARTRAQSGRMFPRYYQTYLKAPKQGDWDVKGNNFFVRCFDPYWHEAHHVVPNSTLADAIADTAEGKYTTVIRHGLANESYNLNAKNNMIMLPMDIPVAKALGLPRHRQTATVRSHKGYSALVKTRLKKIFNTLVDKIEEHEERKYVNVKAQIENLSKELFRAIAFSEAGSLDDMSSQEMGADTDTF